MYAASEDNAMGYGDALITVEGSDDSDEFPTDAGAPEFAVYGESVKTAKFSFQNMD